MIKTYYMSGTTLHILHVEFILPLYKFKILHPHLQTMKKKLRIVKYYAGVHNKYRSWDLNLSIVVAQSLFNHYVRSNLNVRVSHRWANLWDYANACGQD